LWFIDALEKGKNPKIGGKIFYKKSMRTNPKPRGTKNEKGGMPKSDRRKEGKKNAGAGARREKQQ